LLSFTLHSEIDLKISRKMWICALPIGGPNSPSIEHMNVSLSSHPKRFVASVGKTDLRRLSFFPDGFFQIDCSL
jgi:hypothetical protein